jgi:xylulokinase
MNVTVATEQTRKMFGWSHAEMEKQILSTPPGATGLLFLPYLNGERTPNLPSGTGMFHGLTTSNMTPAHMARAVMEGVTLGLAYGLNRFRSLGISPTEIRLTGGGSNSGVWRQICADIFGAATVCLASAEGAALGAAIQAAYACHAAQGKPVTFRELCGRIVQLDTASRCVPDEKLQPVYVTLLARQGEITRRMHAGGLL